MCICNAISLIGSDPAVVTEDTLMVSFYVYHM